MNKLERQVNALMRLCTAEDNDSYEAAKREVKRLMMYSDAEITANTAIRDVIPGSTDLDTEVRWTLVELGVPSHLTGYPFLVRAIILVVKDPCAIRKMFRQGGLYHTLGEQFDSSEYRVERGIRNCIDVAWARGNLKVLERYFGNTVDPSRGKASNTEFIAQVANVIRMRMKQ